jgi:hypothetical protein
MEEMLDQHPGVGWIRFDQLPWSRDLSYQLIASGDLESVFLTMKGSKGRGIRLVSVRSARQMLDARAHEQASNPDAVAERRKLFARLNAGRKKKEKQLEEAPA